MNKFFKVLKIVLIVLAVLVGVGYLVLYMVNPELAKTILDEVVAFINKPLPIVGVSLGVIAVLVWKIFQQTGFGKRAIAKMQSEYEKEKKLLAEEYEMHKAQCSAIVATYQDENEILYQALLQVCNALPNKKLKEIADDLKDNVGECRALLKSKLNEIVTEDVDKILKSKEDLVQEVLERVKKELLVYGDEGKEIIDNLSK